MNLSRNCTLLGLLLCGGIGLAAWSQTQPFADGLQGPENLVFDGQGALYVTDTDHLWKVERDGKKEALYGRDPAVDGISLGGVSIGPEGKVYFSAGNRILILNPADRAVEELVKGIQGFANGNCFDGRGNFFIADSSEKILYVVPAGTKELKVMNPKPGWINGLIWRQEDNTLYFTISAPGRVGGYRLSEDGLAIREEITITKFPFGGLDDLTLDAAGNFYVCLWMNGKIMKVSPDGEKTLLLEKLDGPSAVEFGPGDLAHTLFILIKGGNTKFEGNQLVTYKVPVPN
jgi:sugar lactone lactonase YvrE